jgi:hypothetical protein
VGLQVENLLRIASLILLGFILASKLMTVHVLTRSWCQYSRGFWGVLGGVLVGVLWPAGNQN